MSEWINFDAVAKILVFGLLIGAVLPGLFAIGVRLNAEGVGVAAHEGVASKPNPIFTGVSFVIFGFVFVAVIVGVLFIARDFIGAQTGLYLLGAEPK